MRVLVDTSVLVRLRDAGSPAGDVCRDALSLLRSQHNEVCLCAQPIIEYWVVATRPRDVNGLGLTTREAEGDLTDFGRLFRWLREPPDIAQRWRRLVTRYSVSGKPAHDARLVALMQAHRLSTILTLNPADFSRYKGIRCLTP